MIQLGRCYANGIGVAKDISKAIDCYKAAFRRGDYSANASLAYHYRHGIGVAKDEIEAYAYLSLASDRFPEARTELDRLGAALGSEQRAAGQRRAKEMHAEVEASKESKPLEYR
jgi:TPR repeat protein